jgi:hypothetical protein
MNDFLPAGMVITPFKPHAAEFTGMDQIVVVTEDVSLVTKWYGMVSIEHLFDGATLKGFHLIGAKHLRGEDKDTNVMVLLKRALSYDLESTQHAYSKQELVRLYASAEALVREHPSTLKLS